MSDLDDRHDTETVAREQAAIAAVVAPLAADVAAALLAIAGAHATLEAADGPLLGAQAAAALTTIAVRRLGAIAPVLRRPLALEAIAGYRLGARQAVETVTEQAPGAPPPAVLPDPGPPARLAPAVGRQLQADDDLVDAINAAEDKAQSRLDAAVELARALPMTTQSDVVTVQAAATSAVNGAKADTAWVANRAQSVGSRDVATDTGAGLLWLAERSACLACLALSGQVAYGGDNFPDVTFGDRPLSLAPVPYPPRHPHCRCRCRPYVGPPPTEDMSARDPASALAREARRSVLRGWSEHASEPARARAADRLIRRGANLPATVVARAARGLRARAAARR